MSKSIKILVGYHKPFVLFKSEILVPIHCGREIAQNISKDGKIDDIDYKWLINNCIGDNTGDNISHLNRFFNEMTTIYWAWKNYDKLGNPDYIGFIQYAKHLIFNPYMEISKHEYIHNGEVYCYPLNFYKNSHNLDDEYIMNSVKDYDCLCTKEYDARNLFNNISTCKNSITILSDGAGEKVFDFMCEYITKSYPEYVPYVKNIENNTIYNPFNCFVMKKEVFFKYCEFMFDVLDHIIKEFDFSNLTPLQKRTPGFLSELITSIFLNSIENKYKVKKCNLAVVKDINIMELVDYNKNKFKYRIYKLLSKITFGKMRKHYKKKRKELKAKLKEIKHFLRNNK